MAVALQHRPTAQCPRVSPPGSRDLAALCGRFGYASATAQGWSIGRPTPNLNPGAIRGGRSLAGDELRRLLTVARLRPLAEFGRGTVRVVDDARPAKSRATWQRAELKFDDIAANPFAEVSCGPQTNEKRKHEVTRETIEKVIAACPNAEWRLLFALARYGGLRVPSEVAELKWSDVKWSESRFVVHARKVEHHEGHETRVVPIFEELRPYLEEAFEAAPEGSVHVRSIARPGVEARNLRTQALRIVEAAGVEAWPRLFNNLRASRADELERTFPSHVVDKWIGNSAKIRRDHYLLTLESDFARAAGYPAQNPAQSASGGGLLGPSRRESGSRFSRETRENAAKRYPRQGSNLQPSAPEADALSN